MPATRAIILGETKRGFGKEDLAFAAACGAGGFDFRRAALALGNAGGFPAAAAQIIELGAPYLAMADHLDRIHQRAVDWENPLHPLAIGNLAHREGLVQSGAGPRDADALESLKALARLLLLGLLIKGDVHDLHVDLQRVPGPEDGQLPAASGRIHLFAFKRLDQVHLSRPSAGSWRN